MFCSVCRADGSPEHQTGRTGKQLHRDRCQRQADRAAAESPTAGRAGPADPERAAVPAGQCVCVRETSSLESAVKRNTWCLPEVLLPVWFTGQRKTFPWGQPQHQHVDLLVARCTLALRGRHYHLEHQLLVICPALLLTVFLTLGHIHQNIPPCQQCSSWRSWLSLMSEFVHSNKQFV